MADLRLRVPAVAAELWWLRQALTEWASDLPLRPSQVEALRLASDEAAANVVEHAYRGDRTGVLDLRAGYLPHRHTVTVSVTDHGRWRPVAVDTTSSRGRGLLLIQQLTDSVQITTSPAGTTVHMTWKLDQHPADLW